ncbi:hypothetical protein VaNZ11_009504 [Volvox africanus]|uniref:UmuC domain-containing protein n=1 Tax=Volvox africanus TaxID=51714 RepID=A0ABQ5S7H0_9CHLO|nr:hypothetical protein VaNZ11_009504 [Volvox africanus]
MTSLLSPEVPSCALVLHADVDAIFCQVEAIRRGDGALSGIPLAVQQHQDIIAVDYQARQAGVRKHMSPEEARRLLAAVGGRVVHVYCEDGTRPSYRPYREMSAAFMRLLRGLMPPGCLMEQSSIDEAFILLRAVGPTGQQPQLQPCLGAQERTRDIGLFESAIPHMCGNGSGNGGTSPGDPWVTQAVHLGERIRQEARSQLGLRVSVGISRNKLMAKLASRAAKPDGLQTLLSASGIEQALQSTPISKLPGLGGRTAEALTEAGYVTASHLRSLSAPQLVTRFGVRPRVAQKVVMWARGKDPRTVGERGPPKAIQVQVTLTAVPRPAPTALLARVGYNVVQLPGHQPLPDGPAAIGTSPLPAVAASALASIATSGASVPVSFPASTSIPTARARALDGVTTATAKIASGKIYKGAPAAAAADAPVKHIATAAVAAAAVVTAAGAKSALPPTSSPLPSSPSPGLLRPLLPSTPEGRDRLGRLIRIMAGDLVARVLMDGHQERRWPESLSVKLVTHGPYGKTAAKTCAFPSHTLVTPATPAATSSLRGAAAPDPACGGRATTFPGASDDSVAAATADTATVAAAAAASAAATAEAVPPSSRGSALIIGEHMLYRRGSHSLLLEAVAAAAMGLCETILEARGQLALGTTGPSAMQPVVQVHLTAHSFVLCASGLAVQHHQASSHRAPGPPPMEKDAAAVAGPDATESLLLQPVVAPAARCLSRDDVSAPGGATMKRRRLNVGGISDDTDNTEDGAAYGEARIREKLIPRGNSTAAAATSHLNDIAGIARATATAGPQQAQVQPQVQQLWPQPQPQPQPQMQQRQPSRQPQPQPRPQQQAHTPLQAAGGQLRPWPCGFPAQLDLVALLREMWCGQEHEELLEGSGGAAGDGVGRRGGVRGGSLRRSEAVAEMAARQMDAWLAVFGAGSLDKWWSELGLAEEAARPEAGQRSAG